MIELQNEQLANCLSFDEETFNYPQVEEVPYCLQLICPFRLLPCPRGLSVSGYPLLLPTRPAATLDLHISLLQRRPQAQAGRRHYFVCWVWSGPLGKDERMRAASLPAKGSSRSISFDFVLLRTLYFFGPQRPPLGRRGEPLAGLRLRYNRWQRRPPKPNSFLKQEITLPGKRGHPNRNRYCIIQQNLLPELSENIIISASF